MALGIRGIPGVEGGVETHAEQLYSRLSRLGCDVEVLVRTPFVPSHAKHFGAVRLRRLWSPTTPGLEAFLHSVFGVVVAAFTRPDILHIHAIGPAIVTPIARILGLKVVVTHHGPDYDRDKWGRFARLVLRLGERAGMLCSNDRIAISRVIADHIRLKYKRGSNIIPNGVTMPAFKSGHEQLTRFGLQPQCYFLMVGRMVPEKRHLDMIEAYRAMTPGTWKLAIVCRLPDDAYAGSVIKAARSDGIVLTGFLKGRALDQIYANAGAFVLPSSHEGLPIVLLEALSHGVPVIASDIPANLEIGLDPASYFRTGDVDALRQVMERMSRLALDSSDRELRRQLVELRYDWDRIAQQTLGVLRQVAGIGS